MAFGLGVLALWVVSKVRSVDLDLFHEMALIREALALGALPREDVFAYTATVTPSVHHEWATGAVLYLVTVGLGLGTTGLALLRVALLTGIAYLCWIVARSRGAGARELALVAPAAILLFWPGLSPVRAQMFTFFFLALLLLILEKHRTGDPRWLWAWPALYVVWVNMHGGFVVGVGLLGAYALEGLIRTSRDAGFPAAWARYRPLVAALAVSAPLILVNPYGLDYVPYMWHALLMDRPFISEWTPLWAAENRGLPLMLWMASLLIVAYSVVRGDGWKKGPGLLLVLVAAAFAFRSIRILPIYTVTFVAYVPAALASTPLSGLVRSMWNRHARPVALAALAVGLVGIWRMGGENPVAVELPTRPGEAGRAFPAGAVDYLQRQGFRGNLMTPFGVGAYVSWMLHPDVKVGLDSRYEVAYDPSFVEEAILAYRGQGDWEGLLDRYPTHAVLVASGTPLDSLLAGEGRPTPAQWVERYRDDVFAIFARPGVAEQLPHEDRRGSPIRARFP